MIDTEYLEILRDMKIERLGLDKSTVSSLYEENIYTIGDLLKKSNDELVAIAARRHFSIRTIVERLQGILSELAVKGMSNSFTHSGGNRVEDTEEDKEKARLETATDDNTEDVGYLNNTSQSFAADFGSDPARNHEEEKQEKDLLDTPIVDLDISSKTYYALRFSNIETIREIVSLRKDEIRRYKRLDDESKLKEIAGAIESLFMQANREEEIHNTPFFAVTKAAVSLVNQDYQKEYSDEQLAAKYGDIYSCTKKALKEEYSDGRMWIKIEDICKKIKEKNPSVLKDYIDNSRVKLILEKASWSTSRSIYYCWNPNSINANDELVPEEIKPESIVKLDDTDQDSKTEEIDNNTVRDNYELIRQDHIDLTEERYEPELDERPSKETVNESLSLEDCIKAILIERKNSGREWVTTMTIYDTLQAEYPSIADSIQLVDIREILTKSSWIQKDDFYYCLAPEAESESTFSQADFSFYEDEGSTINCIEIIDEEETKKEDYHIEESITQTEAPFAHDDIPLNHSSEFSYDGEIDTTEIDGFGILDNELQEEGGQSEEAFDGEVAENFEEALSKEQNETSETNGETSGEEYYSNDLGNSYASIKTLVGFVPQNQVLSVMDLPIEKLELSVRAYNCLKRVEILTVGDVLKLNREELFEIRNLGELSAKEIIEKTRFIIDNCGVLSDEQEALEEENLKRLFISPEKDENDVEPGEKQLIGATLVGFVAQEKLRLLKSVPIEALELSVRANNSIKRAHIKTVGELVSLTEEELMGIRNLGQLTREEIIDKAKSFISDFENKYGLEIIDGSNDDEPGKFFYKGEILYNIPIAEMGLSVRAFNCLSRAGIITLDKLAEMSREDLLAIHNMGTGSVNEIMTVVSQLLEAESTRVATTEDELYEVKREYYNSELFRNQIKRLILTCLNKRGIEGASLYDLIDYAANMDDADFVESVFKAVLSEMVSDGTIVIYQDRYKRKYPSVLEAIEDLPEDQKNIIASRLSGKTLEEVAKQNGVTRERIRQIVSSRLNSLHKKYTYFSEDKYKYIFENYFINKNDWIEWIKESEYIFGYLQTMYKRGNKPLKQALEDRNVDAPIRRNIQAKDDEKYIVVGNKRIPRERKEVEDYVIYLYFQDEGTVEEFYEKYEQFLKEHDVTDANLLVTDEVRRTRENRISDSHKVLWKQNRRLRYYDIDGTDFDELFDTLCLEQYENTEISTLKFIRDFPDLMKEYDIRDEYELHNLLKKACDPSRYNAIDFGRMPGIKFGNSSRASIARDMLFRLAPVSQDDLADALSEEYGFLPQSIKANWLDGIDVYYLNGYYHVEDEINNLVSDAQLNELKSIMTDSFYFFDEVAAMFSRVLGQAVKEPSSIVLKRIGFKVFSGYVIKGEDTATDYFYNEMTREDIVDHSRYGTRIRQIMAYNIVMNALKEEYVIFEFEPFKFVNSRRLQSFGIEKADIIKYCNEVKQFVGENEYFTIPWLRKQGFASKLDDLGFNDFFYEAILAMDPGIFSFIQRTGKRKGAALLRVGESQGSKNDFLISLIEREGSIDREDLISLCKNNYGMYYSEHNLFTAIEESDVYYDSIMEKFYANYSMYYDEI